MAFVQRIRHAWDATMALIERAARPVDWRFFSSYGEPNAEKVLSSFDEYARRAYGGNAAVFGIVNAQMRLFSEARFKLRDKAKKLHDHECLSPLENPWPNGTTGDLLARMRQDATLAGNAYIRKVGDDQLERLRPDWVTIVSWVRDGVTEGQETPDGRQLREVLGFLYEPMGDTERQPEFYPVEEVAHWAPTPDPMANWRGMSPITPAIKEINADLSMTLHRQKFFDNAATPNLILKYANKLGTEQRNRIRDAVAARHSGPSNAGGTLVLDEGADPMIVGSQFRDAQFDEIMSAGENRIAVALGVPAIIAGLKQGQDAAAWSMYKQALRAFADIGVRPDWRSACAALAQLVDVPEGYCLWYDTADISALQEGEQEQAAVLQTQLAAISTAITAGFQPDSATAAVIAGDLALLEHTGMVSVQMHDPTAEPVDPAAAGDPAAADGQAADQGDDQADDDDAKDDDDARRAQLLDMLDEILRAFDPDLHPRDHRGRFRKIGAPDLLDGSVPVRKLPDRRLEQLHSEFANDPTVNNSPAVFHLLGDELGRRDQLAAYRRLVDSVPDGEELRQLPEDDVMRLFAEVTAVNDDGDLDRATFDRLGAELDRRLEVETADRERQGARDFLARNLSAMDEDELAAAYDHAAALDDDGERDRVAGEMLRREEAERAQIEAEQAAAREAEAARLAAERAEVERKAAAAAAEEARQRAQADEIRGMGEYELQAVQRVLEVFPSPDPQERTRQEERARLATAELERRREANKDRDQQTRLLTRHPDDLSDDEIRDGIALLEADGEATNHVRRNRLELLRAVRDARAKDAAEKADMLADLPTEPAPVLNPVAKVGEIERLTSGYRTDMEATNAAARLALAKRLVLGLPEDADDKAVKAAEKTDPRSLPERAGLYLAHVQHFAKRDKALRMYQGRVAQQWTAGYPDEPGPRPRPTLPPADVANAAKVWDEIRAQAAADQEAGNRGTGARFALAMARAYGLPDDVPGHEIGAARQADKRPDREKAAAYIAEYRQLAADAGVSPDDRLRYGPPDRGAGKAKARPSHRAQHTPEKDAEVDRLMARGRDWISAYAEVYGGDAGDMNREASTVAAGGGSTRGGTRATLRKAYDEWVYQQFVEAEKDTNGYLLSPTAKQRNARAGRGNALKAIDPLALFSGPAKNAHAHASEELLRWWAAHPRMTFAEYVQRAGGDARGARQAAMAGSKGNEHA